MSFQYAVEQRGQCWFVRTGEGELPVVVREQRGYVTYRGVELLTHVQWQDQQTQAKGVCWLGSVPPPPHIADPSAPASSVSLQQLSSAVASAEALALPPPLAPETLAAFMPPPPPASALADAPPSSPQPRPLVHEEIAAPAPSSYLARIARPLDKTLLPTKLDKVITAILGFPGALIGGFIGLIVGLISAPFTKVGLKQSVKDGMLSFALWGSLIAPPFLGTIFASGLFLLNKCLHTPTAEDIEAARHGSPGAWSFQRHSA